MPQFPYPPITFELSPSGPTFAIGMSQPPSLPELKRYSLSKQLTAACYALTHDLPAEEGTHFSEYIRKAALELHFLIARSAFQKKKKQEKTLANARMALAVIDAAVDIIVEVGLATAEQVERVLGLSARLAVLLEER